MRILSSTNRPINNRFDKGNYLLKEWRFDRSLDELIYQLKTDDVIGRMWAASELFRYKNQPAAIAALQQSVLEDPFWAVRRSAVESLAGSRDPVFISLFKQKCEDKSSRVRVAAIRGLADLKRPAFVKFFKERFEKDDSYLVQAETIWAVGRCGSSADVPFLKKAAGIKSPRAVIKRSAEVALKEIQKLS